VAIMCHFWARGLWSHLLGPRRSLNHHGQESSEPTEPIAEPQTNMYTSCGNGGRLKTGLQGVNRRMHTRGIHKKRNRRAGKVTRRVVCSVAEKGTGRRKYK